MSDPSITAAVDSKSGSSSSISKGILKVDDEQDFDVFRDSPVRYLGYANEVGESFRYQFPKFVTPSYIISFGYCLADAGTKGYDTYNEAIARIKAGSEPSSSSSPSSSPTLDALVTTADTLIWQSLASVMIPGATINAIVKASRLAVQKSPMVLPALLSTWLPTATGLGSIPLIIHPIDRSVDWFMDSTFRKWFVTKKW